jgi:FdhD protein
VTPPPDVVSLALREVPRIAWRGHELYQVPGSRRLPEETAVAFSYEGASYAVMMATPADLEDFAVGFSLTERVIHAPSDITGLGIVSAPRGIVLRMELTAARGDAFWTRRRHLAGPSGCGLCGLESLEEAGRALPVVHSAAAVTAAGLRSAMAELSPLQRLNRLTGALHAAAFWQPDRGILMVREDVGRHNALDKLIGAAARQAVPASGGAVLLTSRVSVEMVQKAAIFGAPVLVAVSAPTALAVRVADAAGITLVAVAREDGFEAFTHPERLLGAADEPEPVPQAVSL